MKNIAIAAALYALSGSAGLSGTLEEKHSMCGAWDDPTPDSRKYGCVSEVYYVPDESNVIYICKVSVANQTGVPPIQQIPESINCYPLGSSPVDGALNITSLGRTISSAINKSDPLASTFSWRTAFWINSVMGNELAFCNWVDGVSELYLDFKCTNKVVWGKYDNYRVPNSN